MAKIKCTICGEIVPVKRSSHLRYVHGIDSGYKGAVDDYFVSPYKKKEKGGIEMENLERIEKAVPVLQLLRDGHVYFPRVALYANVALDTRKLNLVMLVLEEKEAVKQTLHSFDNIELKILEQENKQLTLTCWKYVKTKTYKL